MKSGQCFETCINSVLLTKFTKVETQVTPGWRGLFGNRLRIDFICDDELALEVKWQDSSGTAEQKLVYALEQIRQCHPLKTLLIIGGTGWSKGCLKWAASQPEIMTLDQFFSYLQSL